MPNPFTSRGAVDNGYGVSVSDLAVKCCSPAWSPGQTRLQGKPPPSLASVWAISSLHLVSSCPLVTVTVHPCYRDVNGTLWESKVEGAPILCRAADAGLFFLCCRNCTHDGKDDQSFQKQVLSEISCPGQSWESFCCGGVALKGKGREGTQGA